MREDLQKSVVSSSSGDSQGTQAADEQVGPLGSRLNAVEAPDLAKFRANAPTLSSSSTTSSKAKDDATTIRLIPSQESIT